MMDRTALSWRSIGHRDGNQLLCSRYGDNQDVDVILVAQKSF